MTGFIIASRVAARPWVASAARCANVARALAWLLGLLGLLSASGCAHVAPMDRELLANPAMRFEMDGVADGQRDSIHEITEGGTFPSAGPGNAGAGCGCN